MRLLDIVFSLITLCTLSPFFCVVMVILRFTGEGEVFYRQCRLGKHKKSFYVIKFATMLKNSPKMGAGSITVKDDPRILPVGRILRKTKINEIPQLLNVLRGEMSLIGPRPHVERDLAGVPDQLLSNVLSISPGLSGAASIIFRSEEKILHSVNNPREFYDSVIAPYKAELDLWYRENMNVKVYLELIIITCLVVLGAHPSILFKYFSKMPLPPIELKAFLMR